jgi:hypothetical protein
VGSCIRAPPFLLETRLAMFGKDVVHLSTLIKLAVMGEHLYSSCPSYSLSSDLTFIVEIPTSRNTFT